MIVPQIDRLFDLRLAQKIDLAVAIPVKLVPLCTKIPKSAATPLSIYS